MKSLRDYFFPLIWAFFPLFSATFAFALDGKVIFNNDTAGALFLNLKDIYRTEIAFYKTLDSSTKSPDKKSGSNLLPEFTSQFFCNSNKNVAATCLNNLKLIQSALELASFDSHQKVKIKIDFGSLVKAKCLIAEPLCPKRGIYSFVGTSIDNGEVSCSFHKTQNSVIETLNAVQEKSISLNEFAKRFLAFDSKGYFRPNGGLWFGIDTNEVTNLVIEASCKPKDFYEFLLLNYPPSYKPFTVEKELVAFKAPSLAGFEESLDVKLLPDGLTLGKFEKPFSFITPWESLLKDAGKNETILSCEIYSPKILEVFSKKDSEKVKTQCCSNMRCLAGAIELYNMDNQNAPLKNVDMEALIKGKYLINPIVCEYGGVYERTDRSIGDVKIKCTLHDTPESPKTPIHSNKKNILLPCPDPKLKMIDRLSVKTTANMGQISLEVPDPNERKILKTDLSDGIHLAQTQFEEKVKIFSVFPQLADVITAISKSAVFEDDKIIGIRCEASSNAWALATTVAINEILNALAAPFKKAATKEAQKQACHDNLRLILGATQLYDMDNSQPLNELNLKLLASKEYFKQIPICPENGVYSMIGNSLAGRIKCSIHEEIPPPAVRPIN